MKKKCLSLFLSMLFITTFAAAANVNNNGVVLRGYDPVSYFNDGSPSMGLVEISVDTGDGIYYFSTEENKTMFNEDPKKYIPQYGGYCALAMAFGQKADSDPTAFNITGGKLYLNLNHSIRKKWRKSRNQFIAEGDKNWLTLK